MRTLDPLRARVAARPQDQESALALAQAYLEIGRANSDPRFVSYAQATLVPWISTPHPSAAVLTLNATTLQYLHQFDSALELLDRATTIQPLDGQAWLTKATILQVQGRFDEARRACRPLIRISGQLIALTCLTSVNSLTGRLAESYAALSRVFTDDARLPQTLRAWILEALADMAMRSGADSRAEAYLTQALRAAPQDPYAKAAFADLLLHEGRDAQVIELLRSDEQQDNLLLRLAIAGSRLHLAEGVRWSHAFQERYEAARRDGDFTHLREQARFLLEVRGNAAEALQLAVRNWRVQKEPADVLILLQTAAANRDTKSVRVATNWIQSTHYEDRALDPFLRLTGAAR